MGQTITRVNYLDDFFLSDMKKDTEVDVDIRISGIENDTIVDGPGVRLAVFAQGCTHYCKGCHNPKTHDLNGGRIIKLSDITRLLDKNPLTDGLTISGGEPFLQAEQFALLAEEAKKRGLSVLVFTGFTYEQLMDNYIYKKLLLASDYIIDGKYEEGQRSLNLFFRGSRNQRLIDVKQSLRRKQAVEISSFGV